MVNQAWDRRAWSSVAAGVVLVYVCQAGCLFPDYTFNAPEPSGAGGATSAGASTTGTLGEGGASSTSAQSSSVSGSSAVTSTAESAASSSSASSSGTGGGITLAPANVIDDMEAGSGNILQQGGRVGAWYTYNDGTVGATQAPMSGSAFVPAMIPGGRDGSTEAAHTSGSGFTTWGSGMGFDLHNNGTTKLPYSVAGLTGIAFWARGTPGSVRVKVLILATVDVAEGGSCTVNCGDSHGAIVALTSEWQQYVIPFSSLKQQNWGTPAPWDPAEVLSMQFQVGTGVFDFWVDDIGMY